MGSAPVAGLAGLAGAKTRIEPPLLGTSREPSPRLEPLSGRVRA